MWVETKCSTAKLSNEYGTQVSRKSRAPCRYFKKLATRFACKASSIRRIRSLAPYLCLYALLVVESDPSPKGRIVANLHFMGLIRDYYSIVSKLGLHQDCLDHENSTQISTLGV